ncbi:hypothetical protein [Burkholderia multivorans]|uniref:hypothetical protein n=1 Tax=Burkholderia multivorans TaxID=87883 RepID=UPI00338DA941
MRSSGSPPVMRIFSTPCATKIRDALDLLVREQRAVRQERIVLAEDLAWHAVHAAEVAAIRHRDAQVAQRPAERVGERAVRRVRHAGNVRHAATSARGMMRRDMLKDRRTKPVF